MTKSCQNLRMSSTPSSRRERDYPAGQGRQPSDHLTARILKPQIHTDGHRYKETANDHLCPHATGTPAHLGNPRSVQQEKTERTEKENSYSVLSVCSCKNFVQSAPIL